MCWIILLFFGKCRENCTPAFKTPKWTYNNPTIKIKFQQARLSTALIFEIRVITNQN